MVGAMPPFQVWAILWCLVMKRSEKYWAPKRTSLKVGDLVLFQDLTVCRCQRPFWGFCPSLSNFGEARY